jgi:hypothetical protein
MGVETQTAEQMIQKIRLLISFQHWYKQHGNDTLRELTEFWFSQEDIQKYLNINRYKGVLWFNKEAFEEFLWWMSVIQAIESLSDESLSASERVETILNTREITHAIMEAENSSDFQVNRLLEILNDSRFVF